MKHNCILRDEDGTDYSEFMDAVIDGTFEYDDFYDCYIWHRTKFKPRKWWWPFMRQQTFVMDVLVYCPFCGTKLSEPLGKLITDNFDGEESDDD